MVFDIECACVHKTYAKICAFGYVLCDENFNILEKEDILVNPKGRFELADRRGEKGIVLPYNLEDFAAQPKFPKIYPRIKAMLEDKENVVLGHSVMNDVRYLNLETKRYKLPSFNFEFYDSQLIFMSLQNDFSHQYGLEKIAEELGVEFVPHRAADDAYATMRIVQAMCVKRNCTFGQLVRDLGMRSGRIVSYNAYRPQSRGFKVYNEAKSAARQARSIARQDFANNLSRKRPAKDGRLMGEVFTFSRTIEDDTENSIPLVDRIYALGAKYSSRLDGCTVYVSEEDDATVRTANAKKSGKIKLIDTARLRELLNG